VQGESLFSFLERQVKGQMRSALRQPLSDVSSTVLNKMVSRDVAASLRKYKMGAGADGKRRSKSNGRDDCDDSTVRFSDAKGGRGKSTENKRNARGDDVQLEPTMNNTIRQFLRDLDSGISNKQSLLKMLVIKSDEADQNYNRLRNCINAGQLDAVDR
jgi:hypothetical protein